MENTATLCYLFGNGQFAFIGQAAKSCSWNSSIIHKVKIARWCWSESVVEFPFHDNLYRNNRTVGDQQILGTSRTGRFIFFLSKTQAKKMFMRNYASLFLTYTRPYFKRNMRRFLYTHIHNRPLFLTHQKPVNTTASKMT